MNKRKVKNRVLEILEKYKDDERCLINCLYKLTCVIMDCYWEDLITRKTAKKCASVMIETSKRVCGWCHYSYIISNNEIQELLK